MYFAQILFKRLYYTEPEQLIEHNKIKLGTEIPPEEKEQINEFLEKVKPLDFNEFK